MKVKKTVKVEIEKIIIEKVLCDKCNKPLCDEMYNAFNFDFELKTGEVYPEGGQGYKHTIDLCETCAGELIELLKMQHGYRINLEEWDC